MLTYLAVAPDPDNLLVWKRLPSFFNAKCVNQQLELPRFVFKDGKYYLFFASHKFTFSPGLRNKGLDALYGFVSDSLYGEYRPLNESGLVLANPPDNPIQTFAWVVMPNGIVLSFIFVSGKTHAYPKEGDGMRANLAKYIRGS